MRHEKYIVARKTTSKCEKKGAIGSFIVQIPNSIGMKVCRTFPVKEFDNEQEAFQAAITYRDKMIHQIDIHRDRPYNIGNFTVEQIFEKTLEQYPFRKSTCERHRKVFEKYLKDYKEKNITKVRKEDVLRSLKAVNRECGSRQVGMVKSIWHQIFTVAMDMEIQVKDYTLSPSMIMKNDNVTERSLREANMTEAEWEGYKKFLLSYGGYVTSEKEKIYFRKMVYYILQVMRLTGIRSQEARAIRRDCIEFEQMRNHEGTMIEICSILIKTSPNYDLSLAVIGR